MKKIFCDRCGKEIGTAVMLGMLQADKSDIGIRYTLTSRFGITYAKQYDLCTECQSDLYNWLNSNVKKNGDPEDER